MGLLTGFIGRYPADFGCRVWLTLCGYKSFKALESPEKEDDEQWLTFWLIMSVVQLGEFWTDLLRKWIPYYNEAKLALVIWLSMFRGAQLIFAKVLHPVLKQYEAKIDETLKKGKLDQ